MHRLSAISIVFVVWVGACSGAESDNLGSDTDVCSGTECLDSGGTSADDSPVGGDEGSSGSDDLSNGNGEPDMETPDDQGDSVDQGNGDGPIRQVKAGRHHTCALSGGGEVYCWGQGAFRALGGDYDFQGTPRLIEAFDDVVSVEAGTKFGCAIRPGGEVWCWGENDHGQIGENETIPCGDCTPIPECATSICVATPQTMPGLEEIVELALGRSHGCALRENGEVRCWGDNSSGQVGLEEPAGDVPTPAVVPGVTASQITAGIAHTCALVGSPGSVMCWGENVRAQVGTDVTDAVRVPVMVRELDDAVEIIGGGSHTCARRQNGSVVCWGYNYLGSLGNGSTRPTRATSIQEVVGIDDAVALAAGQYFTCALRSGGTVSCWGDNRHGQLGDGTSTGDGCADRPCRTEPVDVLEVEDVSVLTAGELHACAAGGDGTLWCWGYNLGGQLGTGGVDRDPTPVPVVVEDLPVD